MKVATTLLFTMLACGCASDVANRYYLSEKYPAKPVSEVEVLREEPSRPYFVIADFQSRGEDAEDMRKKAAAVGADAVIVSYLGGVYGNAEQWPKEQQRTKSKYSRVAGTAIKFKEGGK